MDAFAQYSEVKIVALSKPADAYDNWGVNRRAPAIGDVGTVVEILRSEAGAVTYVVECVNPDGSSEWLDDFTESELTAYKTRQPRRAQMRSIVILGIVSMHLGLVAGASVLPDAIQPALAATVYLPLWPLAALGLPVFGPAESGGWPGPSLLGWAAFAFLWAAVWAIVLIAIDRLRRGRSS